MTVADAGSIYVVEEHGQEKRIRFKAAQNDSVSVSLGEFVIPVDDHSIVGSAVLNGSAINIPDLYDPGSFWHGRHNRRVDRELGYQTRSVLTFPLTSRLGEVIGVVQLINKKRDTSVRLDAEHLFDSMVLPFDREEVKIVEALGGLAGILLENTNLYSELQQLFLGLTRTVVAAVDSRDPVTAGHSDRVATLSVALARAVHETREGSYGKLTFTEDDLKALHVAALLHDIGKLGVPESILTKETRLPHSVYLRLMERLNTIEYYLRYAVEDAEAQVSLLHEFRETVQRINVPVPLRPEDLRILDEVRGKTYLTPQGEEHQWLTDDEFEYLSVPRGNLTSKEREVMNSHVTVSFDILGNVPWNRHMSHVPQWVVNHHEKLDGSGYPAGNTDIPLMSRILAVADIYDALRATDRPYKKPLSLEKTREILESEASAGKLDPEIVRLMFDNQVYCALEY